jgi:hypothetical protein
MLKKLKLLKHFFNSNKKEQAGKAVKKDEMRVEELVQQQIEE